MANRDRILGSPRCPENLPPTRPPFRTRPPGGSLGGFPPLILGGQKRAKNGQFLPPCGAKSWGSGGAPPTNLILLRNQTKSSEPRRRPSHARPGPPARPRHPPTPRPPGPVVGGCRFRLGWGSVGQGLGPPEGLRRSQSVAQRREGLNSVCACSDCVLPVGRLPAHSCGLGPAIAPRPCSLGAPRWSLSLLDRSVPPSATPP